MIEKSELTNKYKVIIPSGSQPGGASYARDQDRQSRPGGIYGTVTYFPKGFLTTLTVPCPLFPRIPHGKEVHRLFLNRQAHDLRHASVIERADGD